MKKAHTHPREGERLSALDRLKIMDSIAEQEFDDITFIASQICGTPIALISLVDQDRQWFKSRVGLSAQETPRDLAFCAHAILQDDVFEVPDSSLDERFHDNPLVTNEPNVRFYAGVPVLDPDSRLAIGTLCVIDQKPRTLNASQKLALKALSNQVCNLFKLKQKIAALSDANEKLQFQTSAFYNMNEGVVLQDQNAAIIDFNPAALKILCLTADQLRGKTSLDPDWNSVRENGTPFPGTEHPSIAALSTAQTQKNVIMGIKVGSNPTRWISINAVPLFLDRSIEKPSHVVCTFSDITEQKYAQMTLIQQSQMAALGEMAGGIAHEINTPLAVISAAAGQISKLLQVNPPDFNKISSKAEKINETVIRVSNIVKGLRTLSRDSSQDGWTRCSINQILDDSISLCIDKFNQHQVKMKLVSEKPLYSLGVSTQLSQVFLNLLNNSYDAIFNQNDRWIEIAITEKSGKARISFTDSGSGIPLEIREKIMLPFFTTKEIGKGSGLGLSISKSIIESFKGQIYIDTDCKNTRFIVELPLSILAPESNAT